MHKRVNDAQLHKQPWQPNIRPQDLVEPPTWHGLFGLCDLQCPKCLSLLQNARVDIKSHAKMLHFTNGKRLSIDGKDLFLFSPKHNKILIPGFTSLTCKSRRGIQVCCDTRTRIKYTQRLCPSSTVAVSMKKESLLICKFA